jgi:hypothetical protein
MILSTVAERLAMVIELFCFSLSSHVSISAELIDRSGREEKCGRM